MGGIQPGGISGFKVTNVKGIDFDNFRSFQTTHPKYYGAFMHSSNPDIETRKAILAPLEIHKLMTYTYVLRSLKDGKLYTGCSNDLRKRFKEHNKGGVAATKNRCPFEPR